MVRIVEELRKVELPDVPQIPDVGELVEQGSEVLDLVLHPAVLVQHRRLHRIEHAVEPTEHGEREDYPAVLGLLVVATQQVSHRPDEPGVVVDLFARFTMEPLSVLPIATIED